MNCLLYFIDPVANSIFVFSFVFILHFYTHFILGYIIILWLPVTVRSNIDRTFLRTYKLYGILFKNK